MAVDPRGRERSQRTPQGAKGLPQPKAPARQSDVEERSLIERLKAKDQRAFETLYRRYCSRVYRHAMALVDIAAEAEEVVQEVFLTLYEKAKTFRGEAAFSTWLYRLTVNAALTRLRRRKRNREVSYEDYLPKYEPDGHHLGGEGSVVDWSADIEKNFARKDLQHILKQALDHLRPMDKAVVMLSDLEGVPNREIASALGLTVPAVKIRLHRARLFLRGKLAVSFGHSPY
ncbi:MAG: RNA polymerase sigma factor [Candidatus Methylomirabilales bacterium]